MRRAARTLSRAVDGLEFGAPVTHVYNPLEYAWRAHAEYLRRFADSRKKVLYVGMNPGPWGMSQTGVPFGEVSWVREFLGIETKVGKPPREHPKRPIDGFACAHREVSGSRVWGAISEHFGSAQAFARHGLIVSYCPLAFMEASARNRTPDKLARHERDALFAACDRHLVSVARILEPGRVIGIGAFARDRARAVLGAEFRVDSILHPSPASPIANRGWAPQVREQLAELGVCKRRPG